MFFSLTETDHFDHHMLRKVILNNVWLNLFTRYWSWTGIKNQTVNILYGLELAFLSLKIENAHSNNHISCNSYKVLCQNNIRKYNILASLSTVSNKVMNRGFTDLIGLQRHTAAKRNTVSMNHLE